MGDPNVLGLAPIFWSRVLCRFCTAEKVVTVGRDDGQRQQQQQSRHSLRPPRRVCAHECGQCMPSCVWVWSVQAWMCVCVCECGQGMHAYVCMSVVNTCMLWDIPDRHTQWHTHTHTHTHTYNTQSTLRHALLLDTCTKKLGTSQSLYVETHLATKPVQQPTLH